METIPNEIFCNILLQQPLKSLIRCKYVSNDWQNYIESSEFIKLYHKTSLKNPESNALLIFSSGSSLYIIGDFLNISSYSSHPRPTKLALPSAFRHDSTTKLIGSCNGLLCISTGWFKYIKYLVLNPTNSGVFQVIVNLCTEFPMCSVSGFGYDENSADYKIVHVNVYENRVEGLIYSFKNGLWKSLLDPPNNVGHKFSCFGYLNNSLHYLTEKLDVIIRFDLHDEKWSEINFPDIQEIYTIKDVCIFDGRLTVMLVKDDSPYEQEVWVMKEYDVKESWTKLLTLPFQGSCHILYYSSRLNQYLLYIKGSLGLIWYNEEEEEITEIINIGKFMITDIRLIIGSLDLLESRKEGHRKEVEIGGKSLTKKKRRLC